MACRTSCLCQCHQQGCGCNERTEPYVPARGSTPTTTEKSTR